MAGRLRIAASAALVLASLLATDAAAHPLGNFSINHQTRVQISRDRIELLYILDQAEIPTFQERKLSNEETLARKMREVRANLWLIVNGKRVLPRRDGPARLSYPRGAGGLQTTRIEIPLTHRARARKVQIRDFTFASRVGWADIVAVPGRGTQVRTAVATADPTNRLRTYRGITLQDVTDQRQGTFAVRPGRGSVVAAGPAGPRAAPAAAPEREGEDGFAKVFEQAAGGEGLFLVMLAAAFGWGALHALSPGHGKAMVAAYLVGTRGRPRHAVALGGIVTVTHTIGVFALGLVTLLLSSYILPEDLFPWLNLAAGLLIVAVGLGVLRSRLRWARQHRAGGGHVHDHDPDHGHDHDHSLEPTWKGLAGMGVSAGLIPCPTALVVLLAAISQEQVSLGLVLIVAFSLGLAATIVVLGLVVVSARQAASALGDRLRVPRALIAALPVLSTLVILGVGVALTLSAAPDVM
jgi:ABC-type nickel/cobalt efflux system permease component RcnA